MLSLHLELDTEEKRHVVITTALIIVLFTILVLGGATLPVVKVSVKVSDVSLFRAVFVTDNYVVL